MNMPILEFTGLLFMLKNDVATYFHSFGVEYNLKGLNLFINKFVDNKDIKTNI